MTPSASLDHVRAIADAVLYEGYLLYPYRASSSKNQSRWQFGVLGPPKASAASFAEEPDLSFQCLLAPATGAATVSAHLRFLQLQVRSVERYADGDFVPVAEMVVDGLSVLSWEEAVECEVALSPYHVSGPPVVTTVEIPGGEEIEPVLDAVGATVGRILRRRFPLRADVSVGAETDDGFTRLCVSVINTHPGEVHGKDDAIRSSMIGTHVLVVADGVSFVSLLEPPEDAADAAGRCTQRRSFPVLVGPVGSSDVVMGSPIILYDHPEIAEESAGALFDSTEIDEILSLRVMTMTDAEKAEARATDPRAAAIIDRCDAMSPETLRDLHGVLRDPNRVQAPAVGTGFDTGDVPWWDPATDESVRPDTDSVVIDGRKVARGSLVKVHPSRRADAQDLFFADQVARVTAVLSDVDGSTHVALVLVEDPAADLHEQVGRFFYFAPDELEPLDQAREESHP
ncbi:MAG: hypothetical protein ABIP45_08945 [Knoellia sp.]